MRTLITGGAGFIGSHLAEALLDRGHYVFVLDDLSTGRLENIRHLRQRRGFYYSTDSVTNEQLVADLIDDADVVFHLAAAAGLRPTVGTPVRIIDTNVHGTETVLRHASRHRKHVLVASSAEVYGKRTALPCREDADLILGAPKSPRWGYAASKLLDEFMALSYWKERRVPAIVVRLFNTVGPRQSSRYGTVIPSFVQQALAGEPITVHGDGSQTRSFTWVGDVVSAMLDLVNQPDAIGEICNVGNPEEISIRDLAQTIKRMTKSQSSIRCTPYHEVFDDTFEETPRRVPDLAKIQRLIGYKPRVQLEEMIERVIGYWSQPMTVVPMPKRSMDVTRFVGYPRVVESMA